MTPTPNNAGWNNGDVSIAYTTSDNLSGVASASPPSPLPFTAEGSGQTQSVTVTDRAGNSAFFTSPAVNLDRMPPVTTASSSPAANNNGWNRTAVTVTLSGTDNLSGAASTEYNLDGAGYVPYAGPIVIATEGIHTRLYRSTDIAGNRETARSLTIRIDLTAPRPTTSSIPLPKRC